MVSVYSYRGVAMTSAEFLNGNQKTIVVGSSSKVWERSEVLSQASEGLKSVALLHIWCGHLGVQYAA